MKYEEELIKAIINPGGYLWFVDSNPLSQIHGIAEDCYGNNIEGKFTAAIIYHQLVEKILYVLIKYSDLYIKSKLYPEKLFVNYKEKELDSFGKLLNRHKITIEFPNKKEFMRRSKQVNKLRVKLVHKLCEISDRQEIERISKEIREHFNYIFKNMKEILIWFSKEFEKESKNNKWEKLINKIDKNN